MGNCKQKTAPKGKKTLGKGPKKADYRGYPNDGKGAARPAKQKVDTAAYLAAQEERALAKQQALKEKNQAIAEEFAAKQSAALADVKAKKAQSSFLGTKTPAPAPPPPEPETAA